MKVYLFAIGLYCLWGIFPLYFQTITHLPIAIALIYRAVVAAICMLGILWYLGKLNELWKHFQDKRIVLTSFFAGAFVVANWLVFLFGVENGYVFEISMGYFTLPLLNMIVGLLFFRDPPKWNLLVAMLLAALSLVYQAVKMGSFPWIAIVLAGAFCVYSILQKTSKGSAMICFTMEMVIITPFFLTLFVVMFHQGLPVWGESGLDLFLLCLGGFLTVSSLLTFSFVSRHISLSHLGLMNYITPSLQFLEGLFWFNQELNIDLLISFILIWCGLIVYSIGQIFGQEKKSTLKE